jgi:hypothetical protein
MMTDGRARRSVAYVDRVGFRIAGMVAAPGPRCRPKGASTSAGPSGRGTRMAEDVEELQRLQKQVRATVKERTDLEQRFANPDALRSATARAYRDRDAVTNPLLEEARANVAADIAAFHGHWRHVDKIARNVERIGDLLDGAPTHIVGHGDALVAGLPAVRELRAQVARDLTAAGLHSILPEEGAGDGQR